MSSVTSIRYGTNFSFDSNNIPEIKSFLPIDINPSSRSCNCPPSILHFSRNCLMYFVESPGIDFIDDSTDWSIPNDTPNCSQLSCIGLRTTSSSERYWEISVIYCI